MEDVVYSKPEIYCNNTECEDNKIFDEPQTYKPNENYNGYWDIKVCGKCSYENICFVYIIDTENNCKYKMAGCAESSSSEQCFCERFDCLNNENGNCSRDKIRVELQKVNGTTYYICKAFSNKKISGHFDWTQYPKGGHIDDEYAQKIDHDNRVSRSYPGHFRQANPRKKPTLPYKPMRLRM